MIRLIIRRARPWHKLHKVIRGRSFVRAMTMCETACVVPLCEEGGVGGPDEEGEGDELCFHVGISLMAQPR